MLDPKYAGSLFGVAQRDAGPRFIGPRSVGPSAWLLVTIHRLAFGLFPALTTMVDNVVNALNFIQNVVKEVLEHATSTAVTVEGQSAVATDISANTKQAANEARGHWCRLTWGARGILVRNAP